MKPIYQIKEYGSFVCDREIPGYISLPACTFSQLERFILTNQTKGADPLELMGLSARRGVGKIITAKNYVGIVMMKDGTTIEILPKIYSETDTDPSGYRAKRVLIDMVKTLPDTPYKNLQASNVAVEKMNILEIFIRMFIDEVFYIVKRGLKCHYEPVEENVPFFKGKLKFSQQIKFNHSHRELNYVEYDAFTANRPENRLIKATLLYLHKHSSSSKNRNDIKILLNSFNEIEPSADYRADFSKYIPDSNLRDYSTALLWSKVFLTGQSFASFAGSDTAVALLFPMDTLFERYVATLLKKELGSGGYTVSTQDAKYHLFDKPGKKFLLRPDIVITRNSDKTVFILDAKWKVLADTKANYGISQADMYQMYAYQKKYAAESVTLLYPKTETISRENAIEFTSNDGVTVKVQFVDLFDAKNDIRHIASKQAL